MVKPTPLEPHRQWQADGPVLKWIVLTSGVLAIGVSVSIGLGNYGHPPHFFERFEGNGSAPRIEDAKIALEKVLPLGSTISDYDRFFREHGGQCWTLNGVAPTTAICSYDHGFLISAGWRYVIDYDPVTFRSKHAELNFGLTGP